MGKIGIDKVLHAVGCFMIASVVMLLFYYFIPNMAAAQVVGFAVAMLAGMGKEIADIDSTGFDLKDLLADLVGALVAVLFGFGLQ